MTNDRLKRLKEAIEGLEEEPIPFNLHKPLLELTQWIKDQEVETDKGFTRYVSSDSRPGIQHTVNFSESKGFSCTCEDYKYKSGRDTVDNYECKHIRKVKLEMEKEYVR